MRIGDIAHIVRIGYIEHIVRTHMECPICREPGAETTLACGHVFHAECIGDWLRVKPTCPMCRARCDVLVGRARAGASLDEARRWYEEGMRADFELSLVLLDRARDALRALRAEPDMQMRALFAMGERLAAMGMGDTAERYYFLAVRIPDVTDMCLQARAMNTLGDLGRNEYYERVTHHDCTQCAARPYAFLTIGCNALREGRCELACACLEAALELYALIPDPPQILVDLTRTELSRARRRTAQ